MLHMWTLKKVLIQFYTKQHKGIDITVQHRSQTSSTIDNKVFPLMELPQSAWVLMCAAQGLFSDQYSTHLSDIDVGLKSFHD